MKRRRIVAVALVALALVPAALLMLQIFGGRAWSVPVAEDRGVAWTLLTERPTYRVLRDYADPGATRRMHHHADATWHVLTVATGRLVLTVEGKPPVELAAGQAITLPGGVQHTFTNPGPATATIVEVFGKHP
jgi:quercetin dioxygenase-like cupin family protein